jgi:hypothetical protein
MSKIVEFDQECQECKGTGLYVGMAERDGSAVVCVRCAGTGRFHFKHEYNEFKSRKKRKGIRWVVKVNPGIGVGEGNGHKFQDFGGLSYTDWNAGKPFPPKSEMRRFVCPAWWYQCEDYDRKPEWKECGWGTFSSCQHFGHKEACWARWDREHGDER